MTLHKLNHKYWIDTGRGFRINKLEVTVDPHGGYIGFLWFRKHQLNLVGHLPYRKPKPYPPQPEYITVYQHLPVCDRNLDPDIAHGIAVMLDTYCVWLNTWYAANNDNEGPISIYSPEQWLDWRPDKQLYGSTRIDAMYDSDYYHVVALTTYDGDDGGPTSLTGWWSDYPKYAVRPRTATDYTVIGRDVQLENMTQEFDTLIQFILNDGKFVNGPDEPVTSDTTTTQEDSTT